MTRDDAEREWWDSKSRGLRPVRVRPPLPAPHPPVSLRSPFEVSSPAPVQRAPRSTEDQAMRGHDEERCPSCGSEKIALQGRLRDGTPVRELVCIACKHVWPVDLPALDVT